MVGVDLPHGREDVDGEVDIVRSWRATAGEKGIVRVGCCDRLKSSKREVEIWKEERERERESSESGNTVVRPRRGVEGNEPSRDKTTQRIAPSGYVAR